MLENSADPQLSPFHKELFELLLRNSEKQIAENGMDPESNSQIKAFLKNSSSTENLPLQELIEIYQHLFVEANPAHLEKTLMKAFPAKDYMELGLSRTYPRIYRGLPRLYSRESPSQSQIKKEFSHLPSLKRQALSKALFSLYSKARIKGKITLFTWVMNDGQGDFVAGAEAIRLLKSRLPELDIHFMALVPKQIRLQPDLIEYSTLIPYEKDCPVDLIPREALEILRKSDLILQLPTYYPHTEELKQILKEMNSSAPCPKIEMVGEYGFIESSWFHPRSGNYSLGLHFLEKGILTRKACSASWEDVQNERLRFWRKKENHFYLAYLSTPIGGAIYLHALLKSLENDPADIDLCVPDLGWFLAFYEKQHTASRPLLEWGLGIAAIEIYYADTFCALELSPTGKKLRLLSPGSISSSDFRALLALSGDWVAIRGNQSFSEAVSQGKAFFYDGRGHARFFVKDLAAIAENRIADCPGTLECIRGMVQGFLYNTPVQDDSLWVDETYFQELEDWTAIALKMGLALQDPETFVGFKKIDKIITDEFSANAFLCHLVQRSLFHRLHPYVEQLEEDHVEKFVKNEETFRFLMIAQKAMIESCQK